MPVQRGALAAPRLTGGTSAATSVMTISIFTDIPVWVRPLARALEEAGAHVVIATKPDEVAETGMIVNRVSSGLMGKMPQCAMAFQDAFADWERAGRTVINGFDCYRIGHSKLAQASLFEQCGVKTPQTRAAIPGGRALPGIPVLLKPSAGGFGKGISELGSNEDAPDSLFTSADGWVEQQQGFAVGVNAVKNRWPNPREGGGSKGATLILRAQISDLKA
ncbi:hypothetical protein HQ447_13470, partial [bacterium]|nr:hypothetical protein [bacterium]